MEMSVKVNQSQLDRVDREFRNIPEKGRKALMHALNRTIVGMRTDAKRAVVRHYYVAAKYVAETMTVQKASSNKLEATLKSSGAVIPLIKFKVSPRRVTIPRPVGGIKVAVKKASSVKRLPDAFIAQMSNGHVGIFERSGHSRMPIKQLYGPAIPSMLKAADPWEEIQEGADNRLQKNLDHEIDRILKGYGK